MNSFGVMFDMSGLFFALNTKVTIMLLTKKGYKHQFTKCMSTVSLSS